LLGRDIAPLLNDKAQAIVTRILAEETDGGNLQKFADVIYSDGLSDESKYEAILNVLRELRKGITERFS
jgi:hypothetical protein